MRYAKARKVLIFWCLFIGIGAVGGAAGMFYDPTGKFMGMDALLPYFQVLPLAKQLFQNFWFPGGALLVVNGLTNLAVAGLMLKKRHIGDVLGGVFGVTLMLWICIQFVIFPANVLSTLYFIFGLLQALTGYACLVFYRQEHTPFDPSGYPNVGTGDGRTLVVYFSRLGRTGRAAYECADRLGADICQLHTDERTAGTAGFWWCGRFAMHRWEMKLLPPDCAPEAYDTIVICTPVWVFRCAAPVRAFLREYASKLRERKLYYIAVHFNPWLPRGVFREMDQLVGGTHRGAASIAAPLGRFCFSRTESMPGGEKNAERTKTA